MTAYDESHECRLMAESVSFASSPKAASGETSLATRGSSRTAPSTGAVGHEPTLVTDSCTVVHSTTEPLTFDRSDPRAPRPFLFAQWVTLHLRRS
jgi:hypothetical protein